MNRKTCKRTKSAAQKWKGASCGQDSDSEDSVETKSDTAKRKGKRQCRDDRKNFNGADQEAGPSTSAAPGPIYFRGRYRSTSSRSSVDSAPARRLSSACSTEDEDILF